MNVLGADDKYQPGPLVITIAVTAVCWVLTAFLGPQTERRTLVEFYKTVRPVGPRWRRVREEAGISEQGAAVTHENILLALLGMLLSPPPSMPTPAAARPGGQAVGMPSAAL